MPRQTCPPATCRWPLVERLLLAAPLLRVHFGIPDDFSLPTGLSQREAFVLIDEGFGPGTNGPLLVLASLPKGKPQAFTDA